MTITRTERSELSPKLVGLVGINPFFNYNSSSRLQMFCSHIGQCLVVKGATRKRCQSGMEREFAKYTFSVRMPCNAVVLRVIDKYPPTGDFNGIRHNPTTLVIYENVDSPTREIGVLEIPHYHCTHQHYGFTYVKTEAFHNLKSSAKPKLAKGTILADSPNVTPDGDYMYGIEANVALMSLRHAIEDGVVISRSFAKKLTCKGYGSRVASWGKGRFPLNLVGYGTLDNPKPFPEIGDTIRSDGLIMALREYDDMLSVVEQTKHSLRKPAYNFDKLIYGEPNAKVVDVIIHSGNSSRPSTPLGLSEVPERYLSRTEHFYSQILDVHKELTKQKGRTVVLSPAFERLLVEALAVTNKDTKNRVTLTYNMEPLDEWRVEIVYEYDMEPRTGSKLTGLSGDGTS